MTRLTKQTTNQIGRLIILIVAYVCTYYSGKNKGKEFGYEKRFNEEMNSNPQMLRLTGDTYIYTFMKPETGQIFTIESDLKEAEVRTIVRYMSLQNNELIMLDKYKYK